MPFAPATRAALLRGRELFDGGRYFEAHEVWEEAWLHEAGKTRRLLQGLIQIAAALHKVSRAEHPRGALRLLDAGLAKLEGIGNAEAGLALDDFRIDLRTLRGPLEGWALGNAPPPELRPALHPLAGKRRNHDI
jgi:predicted metal-dependent hydrolase